MWVRHTSRGSGKPFLHCAATGETRWPPASDVAKAYDAVAAGARAPVGCQEACGGRQPSNPTHQPANPLVLDVIVMDAPGRNPSFFGR